MYNGSQYPHPPPPPPPHPRNGEKREGKRKGEGVCVYVCMHCVCEWKQNAKSPQHGIMVDNRSRTHPTPSPHAPGFYIIYIYSPKHRQTPPKDPFNAEGGTGDFLIRGKRWADRVIRKHIQS